MLSEVFLVAIALICTNVPPIPSISEFSAPLPFSLKDARWLLGYTKQHR